MTSTGTPINYGSALTSLLTAGAGAAGASTAAGAQVAGINNAIGTQQGVQQQNQSLFNPQIATGDNAMKLLTSALTPNSGFNLNSIPGLTQATGVAETAQNNMYASYGQLGNSGTPAQIGNYIAGNIALPAYNNYVQNLTSAAGLGSTANQSVAQSNLSTGANISQLQQNAGVANASGVAGVTSALTPLASLVGSGLNSILGSGVNASGVAGTAAAGGATGTPGTLGSPDDYTIDSGATNLPSNYDLSSVGADNIGGVSDIGGDINSGIGSDLSDLFSGD